MPYSRLAVFLAIFGTMLFFAGHHSIDTAWNMHTVNCDYNAHYTDTTMGGLVYTPSDAYRQGFLWVLYGFTITVASCLYLTYERKKKPCKEPDVWNF